MKARVQNTPSPALWLYTPGEGHEKTALAVMAAAQVAQQSLDNEADRAIAAQFLSEVGEQK